MDEELRRRARQRYAGRCGYCGVSEVVEQEDGRVHSLTSEGAFLIQRLRLNRPQLVAYRLHQRAERQLCAERDALRERVRELQQDIAELHRALETTEADIDREGR